MKGRRITQAAARKAGRTLSRYGGQRREAATSDSADLRRGSSEAAERMSSRYWGRRRK